MFRRMEGQGWEVLGQLNAQPLLLAPEALRRLQRNLHRDAQYLSRTQHDAFVCIFAVLKEKAGGFLRLRRKQVRMQMVLMVREGVSVDVSQFQTGFRVQLRARIEPANRETKKCEREQAEKPLGS